jgi:hypothetical protein
LLDLVDLLFIFSTRRRCERTQKQGDLMVQPRPNKPKKARKANRWKRPPGAGGYSTKNSHTSPRAIALRRLQAEALSLRERGCNYQQIANQMKRPMTTVYRWVSDAINAIVQEPAREVLCLELQRLDAYLAAYHGKAIQGDLPATEMALKIIEKRARLLGLYPEMGKQQPALAIHMPDSDGDELFRIEFVTPTRQIENDPPPVRDLPPSKPEPPTLDLQANKPTSVPIVDTRRKREWDWS